MVDSIKYLDFLVEKVTEEARPVLDLENSRSPMVSGKSVEGIVEQMPRTQKSEARSKYESILKDTENGVCGEEIMRTHKFKRRRDLESFLYSASIVLDKPLIKINYETNLKEGEKPLHPLKIARDGSLRISRQQISRRAKLDVFPGTEFVLKPLDNGESGFKLLVVKK